MKPEKVNWQGDMSIRDYFAIHCPQSILSVIRSATFEEQARQRYLFADAMMKARKDAA